MTVGIGFKCRDGVVFCSDSQTTNDAGLKRNEKKIYAFGWDDHAVICAYAGSVPFLKYVSEKIELLVEGLPLPEYWDVGEELWTDMVRKKIESLLKTLYKTHGKEERIEFLCGISTKAEGASLFRCKNTTLHQGSLAECIGVGDSSVLAYLSELFAKREMTTSQAILLGCYLVAQGKKYINGVGGPTQCSFLTNSGDWKSIDMEMFEEKAAMPQIENALSELMCLLTAPRKSARGVNAALMKFRGATSEINWTEYVL